MSDDRPTPQPLRSGKSLRILVVEDHADTLRVLARLLDHFGHKISVADSTHSAKPIKASPKYGSVMPSRKSSLRTGVTSSASSVPQFLQSKTFDVILSDISLPDGSGYEVVSQAKQKQAVKAVALTGFDREEDIRRGKEAGFDFHLSKPVDFHELRTVLNQVSV